VPRYAIFVIAAIVTGVVAAAVIAGGGDDEPASTTRSVPELTPPPGSIGSDEGSTGATGRKGTTGDSSPDGTPADTPTQTTPATPPSGGSGAPSNDTQDNDVPPPKGSPAQRFEEFCKENKGAC
jgi:hypothetical protein